MLLIGRRKPYKGNDFGGVVILYELFLKYFEDNGITYKDIDLNWRNYPNKAVFLLTIYGVLFKEVLFSEHQRISFHGTTTDFTYYAPLVVFFTKIMGKRITLRKFGGNFDQYYEGLNIFTKSLVTYALKNADTVFYETKYLVNRFKQFNQNSVWFPNIRKSTTKKTSKNYKRKVVFLGHVRKEKGIRELVEASNNLNGSYDIDIYGPIVHHELKRLIKESGVSYKGVLQPDHVVDTLASYDVLILPSYREGYPGVIIEALSVGMPVIATDLPSINEMVEDGKNGFLVEPQNPKIIEKKILKFDQELYEKMRAEALRSFVNFDQEKVMQKILPYL